MTISRGNFFFHTQKILVTKSPKKKENNSGIGFITAEQAGNSEKLHKMSPEISSEPLEQQQEQLRLLVTYTVLFNMKNIEI